MAKAKQKSIEEKYKSLTETEHVLLRPGTYVGSTVLTEPVVEWVYDGKGKFEERTVRYVPALLKLFDEIFSNSVDESKRNPKLNTINITVDTKKNIISVYDNGGIPVEMHKTEKMYVPTLIFSKLRAGSNFDDTEKRDWVGTNGLGATLTNIFSTKFTVKTADGKKEFVQVFEKNMSKQSTPKIKAGSKKFTEITFEPDLGRFGINSIDEDHLLMMQKRVIDAAATNPNLKIKFNGKLFSFKSFEAYCGMYCAPIRSRRFPL